jgi:hypothetical protein
MERRLNIISKSPGSAIVIFLSALIFEDGSAQAEGRIVAAHA